jgi:hypothetical protein
MNSIEDITLQQHWYLCVESHDRAIIDLKKTLAMKVTKEARDEKSG